MNFFTGFGIEFQSVIRYSKKLPGSIQRFQINNPVKGVVLVETFSCIHIYCGIGHYPSCPKESGIGYGSLIPVRLFP